MTDEREIMTAYNKGLEEGKKHTQPSQQTIEMFSKFGEDIAELKGHFNPDAGIVFQILEQTKITNGSVASLMASKNWLWGAFCIVTILVIPLISFIFIRDINSITEKINELENKIEEKVTYVKNFNLFE